MGDDGWRSRREERHERRQERRRRRRVWRDGGLQASVPVEQQRRAMVLGATVSAAVAAAVAVGLGVGGHNTRSMVMALAASFIVAAFAGAKRRAERARHVEAGSRLTPSARDRDVLEAAAANDGWVTPAMVARHTHDLSLDEAKATLDDLLAAGHCTMDSDDEGRLYYHFAMSGKPGPTTELSAEEWVDQAARRLDPADAQAESGAEDVDA